MVYQNKETSDNYTLAYMSFVAKFILDKVPKLNEVKDFLKIICLTSKILTP